MAPFRRTNGVSTGPRAAVLGLALVLAPALAACDSAPGEAQEKPVSVSASPAPSGTADPEAGDGDPANEAGDGAEDDGAGDVVTEGRDTTGVVPLADDLSSDAVSVDEGSDHGLSVELVGIEQTTAEPSMPGEIAGPALRVEVAVTNDGSANHALDASVVNLYYGPDRVPASSLSGSGEEDLPDSVPEGKTVTGAYEFAVPDDRTERVLVEIDIDPQLHVALFEGEISP